VIQKPSIPTLELETELVVADHIDGIAAAPNVLIGGHLDSQRFLHLRLPGRLIRKVVNPAGNSYQDPKFIDGRLMGSAHSRIISARSWAGISVAAARPALHRRADPRRSLTARNGES
jgi:hypothetical protein